MDCKKVLVETDGDIDKAIELLREKGLAKAAKKAGRIAAEGLVKIAFSDDNKEAAVVEVNSETDFVAKNEEFVQFVEKLADMALTSANDDIEAFKTLPYEGEGTVADALSNKIAKIGENKDLADDAIDTLMVAKYLERIADHAVNVCEWVIFYSTGLHKKTQIL